MTIEIALAILGGLMGLGIGGELLVRGAVGIATRLGLSGVVTGVVIIGSATSMPELVASLQAAMLGSPEIAWGNIAGSNISNVLLILGCTALVTPFALSGAGRRDAAIGLAAAVLLWVIAGLGLASPGIGAGLLALTIAYFIWRIRHPGARDAEDDVEQGDKVNLPLSIVLLAGGVGALIIGAQWLVSGAIDLARVAGLSETVIGLTVVAIGTSLPELGASLVAALRGRPGMALGNVAGSNIYNLLLIGGVTMSVSPVAIPRDLLDLEWPVMVLAGGLLLVLCRYVSRLSRGIGALMVGLFAANTALLLLLEQA